jgi:class 3 adenylate cyclase
MSVLSDLRRACELPMLISVSNEKQDEQQQLEAGIAALEVQRARLGDAVVEASVAGLRARLAALQAAQAPEPDPAQALRQVTILFLDVVGSTALAQYMDPESVSAVMDDALARGTVIVQRHAGKVLKYAGDNILAVFGAQEVCEDDAERAVHCGLELVALGHTLGNEVLAAHGHEGFNVRVGIHTGGVLLGGGVDAEGSIRGSAVNLAARMEQSAPAGALRISGDTFAQVRGLFEVEAQAPLTVKGIDDPVQSYLVLRARPRQFRLRARGIEGVVTRMIGRDAELELLQAAFRRVFQDRRFAAVTVVADAGIGKSRLLDEFAAWSDERPEHFLLFRGRATPRTGTQAYGLLRDILAWRFQIAEDDRFEVARKKLEDGIVPLFTHDDGPDLAEAHAHLLGHLVGIDGRDSRHIRGILDDPRQIRNRAFHAAAQMFRRFADREGLPVVLQLDDLHWADGESLDFLDYLAEVDRDVPLLRLGFTRPTLFERRADWGGAPDIHHRIELHPLSKDVSRMLANELLKKLPEIPAALRELLTSSAEGNPFYMEELVRMLIDQGAIQAGETWMVDARRLLVTKVPPTLAGVLQARLDGLPAPEKRALQQASVIGAVFWDQALAAVDEDAAQQLPALVQRELTPPRADSAIDGLRAYAFRHALLHQVTYDTVLKRARREGHARVACWLAGLCDEGGLRAGDLSGLAAEHFEHAGDDARAAEFHARAAEQAGQRFAHERVLHHVGRALVLLGAFRADASAETNELRWRLLDARERTFRLQARRDEQAADVDAMERLADALDDDHRRADAARRRAFNAQGASDWVAAENATRRSMACAARAGDDARRLFALATLASARTNQRDFGEGRTLALQGLAEARRLRLRRAEGLFQNTLVTAASLQSDLIEVLDRNREALKIAREIGDRRSEAVELSNAGIIWTRLGDLTQGRRDLEAALQMLRAVGDRLTESNSLSHLSEVAYWHGEEMRALTLARSALDIAVSARSRDLEVWARINLGHAELALGRLAAARQVFSEARVVAQEIEVATQHDASAGLAQVALAEGDADAALAAIQPVLDLVAAGGSLDHGAENPRLVELSCHQALARASDPRAGEWLQRAHVSLMARADAIGDAALRQGFLNNIPHHREIVAAWANWPPRGAPDPAGTQHSG